MLNSRIRFVPWRNKKDWEDVYKNVFSRDPSLQRNACDVINLWMILRDDVPPGIDCTLSLLKVLLVDKEDSKPSDSHDLKLMFSTAVLRVINFVCDNSRKTITDNVTLYQIAKSLNIPDWIVNLRHDISHGKSLPDLSMLRMASQFLLTWLKEYYWEMERENLVEVFINRSREEVCKENIKAYMDLYTELTLWKMKGVTNSSDLPDELMIKLLSASQYCARKCMSDTLPWLDFSSKCNAAIEKKYIQKKKVDFILVLILKQLKDYFSDCYGFDGLSVVAEELNRHRFENNGISWDIWNSLIQFLNHVKMLDKLMLHFSEMDDSNMPQLSNTWLDDLTCAVQKRQKLEQLKESLSSPSEIYLDPSEEKVARKILLKRRLNLVENNKNELYNKLFKRVEKAHPQLKSCIRLKDNVGYMSDTCVVQQMIDNVLKRPNFNTLSILKELFQLMSPRYPPKVEKQLRSLVKIYLGKKAKNSCERPSKPVTLSDLCPEKFMEVENKSCDSPQKTFYRTGWNFNGCCLGITPWALEGVKYHHKPFNQEMSPPFIFPFS